MRTVMRLFGSRTWEADWYRPLDADGSPITVNDVKWSLDRARNPDNGIWGFTLASVDSIETQGEDTVILRLKHPDPTLIAALATFNSAIMPQKQFEAAPGANDAEKAKAFAEHPVGSGPFQFDSWQRGTELVIKRNPHYWQMGEDGKPLPYLDEVRFPVIPDDATRILKLQAGEVDGAEFIPYARVAELKNDPNLEMMLYPSTRVQFLTVNEVVELDAECRLLLERYEAIERAARLPDADVRALDEVPEPYREVLHLRIVQDLPYEEIARVVECPVGTVKSRMHRARAAMMGALAVQEDAREL